VKEPVLQTHCKTENSFCRKRA